MLTLFPSLGTNFHTNDKSKCAEIYYQTEIFLIKCLHCDISILNFNEFMKHFNDEHSQSFENLLHISELITDNRKQNQNSTETRDPLQNDCKIQIADINIKTESLYQTKCDTIHTSNLYNEANKYLQGNVCDGSENTSNHKMYDITKSMKGECFEKEKWKPKRNNYLIEEILLDVKTRDCIASNLNSDGESKSSYDINEEDIDWSKPFNPNSLKNHQKRPYKPRNKPNACTYCGRTFRRRYQLDTHMNIHTGKKPHQCEICGRQFRAVTTLQRHRHTHEHRVCSKCKYCEKTFRHRAALVSHEMRHTQKRNIPCDICAKAFYTANQMDTHKRKVHMIREESNNDILPFACKICEKRYRSASMLSTHKLKKHYRSARYECEQCEKKFVNENELNNHNRIHINGAMICS